MSRLGRELGTQAPCLHPQEGGLPGCEVAVAQGRSVPAGGEGQLLGEQAGAHSDPAPTPGMTAIIITITALARKVTELTYGWHGAQVGFELLSLIPWMPPLVHSARQGPGPGAGGDRVPGEQCLSCGSSSSDCIYLWLRSSDKRSTKRPPWP